VAPTNLTQVKIRLTPAQIRKLDAYCAIHGDIPRATAARQLLAAQLRYAEWKRERELRGLPTTGRYKSQFPKVEYEEVRDITSDVLAQLPNSTPAAIAFNIGRKVGLEPVNRRIYTFVKRALRERQNERVEADMNRAAEEGGGQ
jgi:hypothetical protein